jgi:hypothetical protein
MNLINASTAKRNRDMFDYKSIFLTKADGSLDTELAGKYSDQGAWLKAHREDTKNAFADIDPNNLTAPQNRERILEIAEKVFSRVQRTISLYDPIPLIFHTQSYSRGEKPEIHDVYGGRVYERAYGAYSRMSRLTQTTYTISPYQFSVHIAEPIETLQSGRITVADVTFAMSQAILARRIRFAYDTLIAAYTAGGGYATNEGGTLEKSNMDLMIRTVAKYSDVGRVNCIGAYVDIVQANDFTTSDYLDVFPESTKEELMRRGVLGGYMGSDLVAVKYWVDDRYAFSAFPSGSIFAFADAGKPWNEFAEWPTRTASWGTEGDGMMHWLFDFEIGAAVWKAKYGHRLYGITNTYGG